MNQLTPHAAALTHAITSLVRAVDLHRRAQRLGSAKALLATAEQVDLAVSIAHKYLDARTCQQIVTAVSPKKSIKTSL